MLWFVNPVQWCSSGAFVQPPRALLDMDAALDNRQLPLSQSWQRGRSKPPLNKLNRFFSQNDVENAVFLSKISQAKVMGQGLDFESDPKTRRRVVRHASR